MYFVACTQVEKFSFVVLDRRRGFNGLGDMMNRYESDIALRTYRWIGSSLHRAAAYERSVLERPKSDDAEPMSDWNRAGRHERPGRTP